MKNGSWILLGVLAVLFVIKGNRDKDAASRAAPKLSGENFAAQSKALKLPKVKVSGGQGTKAKGTAPLKPNLASRFFKPSKPLGRVARRTIIRRTA